MLKIPVPWLLLIAVTPLAAEVKPAPLFQNGAVLQRDKPVPVWGRSAPGETLTVSFAGQTKTTSADAAGRWQVSLDAMPASADGRTLTISGSTSTPLEIKDILVGEVWLASGQSNMQWTVSQARSEDREMAVHPVPLMRLFQIPRVLSHARQESVDASWTPANPENVEGFSAVAFFFGLELTRELKVPVGMIHGSWGGSRIEPWWAEEGLAGIPALAATRTQRLSKSPGFPEYDTPLRKFVTDVRDWADAADKALDQGLPAPDMPTGPGLLKLGHRAEAGTYQAMIHPLVPFALRGFLWYQGESNNGEGMAYTAKMHALIQGWRKQFRALEAPFLFVQLAPFNYGPTRPQSLAEIWWAQQETLKIPHTGMAVTNDIGDLRNIHPANKSEVGKRLARWALADAYGKRDLVKSGPLFAAYEVTDQGIVLRFDHSGGGLTTRDGKQPDWFEIAGIDGVYKPAVARIADDGKSILLTNSAISKPDRARFAWSQNAEPNLMNKEGLPAAAFHTHWPVDPSLGTKVSTGKPIQSSHPNANGWDGGLTDGTWGNAKTNCYATSEAPAFPKTVTVDLGAPTTLHLIRYGTPDIGSTKTVAVSISADGTTFQEVGRNAFPPKKAATADARFEPRKARFVRATFLDHHPAPNGYSPNFGFLSELEAYTP